jgi:hypothetical protein
VEAIYLDSMSTSITQPLRRSLIFLLQMTLIMCDANRDQILNLDHILICFEVISGLKRFNLDHILLCQN